jgi:hypothetical protein
MSRAKGAVEGVDLGRRLGRDGEVERHVLERARPQVGRKKCKLARGFLWGNSYKRLKLGQLLGRNDAFLTWRTPDSCRVRVGGSLSSPAPCTKGCASLVGAGVGSAAL